jgi:hypothetical protein
MMPARPLIRVFISSTSEDLHEYRAVARNVILDMDWQAQMMEHFGASEQTTVTACREKLCQCQLMLLIVAFRGGWVPKEHEGGNDLDSITALELQYARAHNIAVLPFLASEETWPGRLWENDQAARDRIKQFRGGLNQPAAFFDYEPPTGPETQRLPAFRAKIRQALVDYKARLLTNEVATDDDRDGLDYFDSARERLVDGDSIPFLGQGIFDGGPFGTEVFLRQLVRQESALEPNMASAAEYQERYLGNRGKFLQFLQRIVEQGSRVTPALAVHDLLLGVPAPARPPTLFVSTTLDLVFEERLKAAGKRCVIAAHIIRSEQREDDGKILVLRGEEADICLADRVDVTGVDCVVYKPLGSPLLHRYVDPDKEIDTVVITETDYLTFLGRLQNQSTKIPAPFYRPLQRRPLLFLGYPLDVWHCRLLMQVFETVGLGPQHASFVAVRQPASPMEELVWKRLGADLLRMDPNVFAKRVSEETS